MTREQAARLVRAADALPQSIGSVRWFVWDDDQGKRIAPVCAVGHLCWPIVLPDEAASGWMGRAHGAYGADFASIECVNDDAGPDNRRAAVIAECERQIRAAGWDPDELRRDAGVTA